MIHGERDQQADIRGERSARSPLQWLCGRQKQNWPSILFAFLAAVFALAATMLVLDYVQRAAEPKKLRELVVMTEDRVETLSPASGVPPVPSLSDPGGARRIGPISGAVSLEYGHDGLDQHRRDSYRLPRHAHPRGR